MLLTLSAFLGLVIHPADVASYMSREGSQPKGSTPDAYARLLNEEVAKWAEVVRRTGLTAN